MCIFEVRHMLRSEVWLCWDLTVKLFFSFDANINKIIYLRCEQYFVLKLLFKRTDDNDKFIFDFFSELVRCTVL